uniref:DUF4781 domain-containing protein n=1 Tax=Panagrolaimus sp. PS1159 TaxID=55785 RepID=A0AC35FYC6_9BILA
MVDQKVWSPTLVTECKNPPIKSNRCSIDWSSKEVQEWKANAIKMQEAHVKDNSRTLWFSYLPEERDAIELRILITLYGIRTPQQKTKAAPSCPLKTYSHEERLHAKKVKKSIIKQSGNAEKICFNVIFISHATIGADEKLLATEEPVFIVKGSRRPVDRNGRGYNNFDSYTNNNDLDRGGVIYPENGTYTPEGDERVNLIASESPNSSLLCRAKAITDTVVMVGGIVLTVTGLVLLAPVSIFSAATTAAIASGSFYGGAVLTAYSVISSGISICNKLNDSGNNDESIRTEIFTIATAVLSAYTQRLSSVMAVGAKQGKTLADTINGLTKLEQKIFPLLNYIKLITMFSGVTGLCSAFIDLWKKKERSWLDYFQFSMLLFMTANTLAKPWTLKGIFDSEQMKCLDAIKDELNKDESKTEFDKMREKCENSNEKAYMIRNLNQIENKNEFFELINKTGSVVECTADGLIINHKIDIHPSAYNAIGKDIILMRNAQAAEYENASFQKSIENKDSFGNLIKNLDENQVEEFKQKLSDLSKLPNEQRQEAMKELYQEFGGNEKTFDQQWEKGKIAYEKDMTKQINKMVTNMSNGITDKDQIDDFKKLQELSIKQVQGVITADDKEKLKEIVDKCSAHRKERFFQSSADYRRITDNYEREAANGKNLEQWKADFRQLENNHKNGSISNEEYNSEKEKISNGLERATEVRKNREQIEAKGLQLQNDLNNAEMSKNEDAIATAKKNLEDFQQREIINEVQKYSKDITTFNNGQSERLCYRIDVEKVKYNLQEIYGRSDYENVTINGKKLFENMSLGDYDRLNRVLNVYERQNYNKTDLMNAASAIAQDQQFQGLVQSPRDLACITEAMVQMKVRLIFYL